MAPSKPLYRAEFYKSNESIKSPYAVTRDETLWDASSLPMGYKEAMDTARGWTTSGHFKSCRVVELDDDGNPTSVAWASAWEAPVQAQPEQGAAGTPGFACKLMVWMEREKGDPDHWNWRHRFESIFGGNNNAWDLVYGREVDTRGKMTLYSIKLNLYPVGRKHPSKWNWWEILDKDPDLQRDDVEFVRATEIEPREFPAGVETLDCAWCGKTHAKATTWMGFNPDNDEMEPHCSCFCIDERFDPDMYREDPDGLEFSDPGCVQVREGKVAA